MNTLINKYFGIREGLDTKWWHRLLKVLFFFSLVLIFTVSLAISISTITPNKRNTIIINNLKDFTASSNYDIVNTIPFFLKTDGEIGCYNSETKKISYASEYFLQKSFCSFDIINRADDVVNLFNKENPGANYTRSDLFNKVLNKDTEKRYCLINKDVDCLSKNIVKYRKTSLFYIEAMTYSLVVVSLLGLLLIFLYNRVFLYIIFGHKKKTD